MTHSNLGSSRTAATSVHASLNPYFLPFFFQAEDGIRDGHVTGVQTCALPIWLLDHLEHAAHLVRRHLQLDRQLLGGGLAARSEERRVGKECRSRWSPYH